MSGSNNNPKSINQWLINGPFAICSLAATPLFPFFCHTKTVCPSMPNYVSGEIQSLKLETRRSAMPLSECSGERTRNYKLETA